jgi:type VI secretion system protein ImpF
VTVAKKPNQQILLPSLIDRLIDREPENRKEARDARAQSLREMKDSVRRDLEWLLNTRRCPVEPAPSAKELLRSVYCYGLPDITGVSLSRGEDQNRLARLVETVVATFEPRLQNVTVSMKPVAQDSHMLRFQIEALLRTEPAPSRVFFDTTLELTKGEYEVAGETRAR